MWFDGNWFTQLWYDQDWFNADTANGGGGGGSLVLRGFRMFGDSDGMVFKIKRV